MRLSEEKKLLEKVMGGGVVFRSRGVNCEKQRAVMAAAVVDVRGGGMSGHGNSVRSWKRLSEKSGRHAEAVRGMLELEKLRTENLELQAAAKDAGSTMSSF